MNLKMETVLTVISAVFVLYAAMIEPSASFVVALVAIVFILGYMVIFPKSLLESKKTSVKVSKVVVKKSLKKSSKKK